MSRRRNGRRIIHTNTLHPSTPDDAALAAAVEEKFLDLCESYRRIKGDDLIPPLDMSKDLVNWRTMRIRHRKMDYRNSDAEIRSVKVIAQWTVDMNNEMRNQSPRKPIEFREGR